MNYVIIYGDPKLDTHEHLESFVTEELANKRFQELCEQNLLYSFTESEFVNPRIKIYKKATNDSIRIILFGYLTDLN